MKDSMPEADLPPENLEKAGREVLALDMQEPYSCSFSRIMSGKGTDADFRFYKAAGQFLEARELDEQMNGDSA